MDEVGTGQAPERGVTEDSNSERLENLFCRYVSHALWLRGGTVVVVSVFLASCASHLLATWLGVKRVPVGYLGIYRRVGPESGPQVFCAGSSLLESGLSWPTVSQALGQGIETWGVGGSSPDIWEKWQQQRPLSNPTIIGISVYDLNEQHLADARATVVPLSQTISDLRAAGADSALSHRILSQYGLRYVRILFPTAGDADKVLDGLRSKMANVFRFQGSLAAREGVVTEPPPRLLDAGESTASVDDWSSARLLRRTAILRAENRGRHDFFNGPKHRAFLRMVLQARRQGRVIVVILPVSTHYIEAFLGKNDIAAFERSIYEAMALAPDATLVRLDRLPGISDPRYFSDLVHMNSLGRRVTTQAFLTVVTEQGSNRSLESTGSTASK